MASCCSADECVKATAHDIGLILGSSDTDDMLSVNDRSFSLPRDAACDSPSLLASGVDSEFPDFDGADPAMPLPDRHPSVMQSSEMIIMRWELGSSVSVGKTFIWVDQPDEAASYLGAVDVQKLIASLPWETTSSAIDRAQNVPQLAMHRLKEEFRNLLERYGESVYPEWLLDPVPDASLGTRGQCIVYGDDEGIEENGEGYDEVAKSRSIAQMTLPPDVLSPQMTLPSDVLSPLCDIATRMVRSGYQTECSQVYVGLRNTILERSLQRLGPEKVRVEEVQSMPWKILESEISSWIYNLKIAIGVLFPIEKQLCERVFKASLPLSDSCFTNIARPAIMQLLNFGEAVAIAGRAPEKILDMCETLRDLLASIESIFAGAGFASLRSKVSDTVSRLSDAVDDVTQQDASKDLVPCGAQRLQFASVGIPPPSVEDGSGHRQAKVPWSLIVMGSSYYDFWIAFNIFLSAGLYLFDFATNILTAVNYYSLGKEKGQQYGISGIFPTILCIIIGAHVLNVIIFRCTYARRNVQSFKHTSFL